MFEISADVFEMGNQLCQNHCEFCYTLLQEWDRISCLERMCPVNLMMKMCQVDIRQCDGYTQHKPEAVDYREPFRDFLHQILKVYTPKRVLKKIQLSQPYCKKFCWLLASMLFSLNFVKIMGNFCKVFAAYKQVGDCKVSL